MTWLDDHLADQLGRPLYDSINQHLRNGQLAELAIARIRKLHYPASDWSWKPLGCQHNGEHDAPCRGCRGECWPCPTIHAIDGDQPPAPAHDAGPSVAECAAADRLWPLQKGGE